MIMSHEFYFWCLVDRYLSTGYITYREALKAARKDVNKIPHNKEMRKWLSSYRSLNTKAAGVKPKLYNKEYQLNVTK
jgi:hypothetical protein